MALEWYCNVVAFLMRWRLSSIVMGSRWVGIVMWWRWSDIVMEWYLNGVAFVMRWSGIVMGGDRVVL